MPKYKTGSTPPHTHTNTRKRNTKHKNQPTKTTTLEKNPGTREGKRGASWLAKSLVTNLAKL